jgi:hypothetical protein
VEIDDDNVLLDPGEGVVVNEEEGEEEEEEEEILEGLDVLEDDELAWLVDCDEETDVEEVLERLLVDEELAEVDVDVELLLDDIAVVPVLELDTDDVCDNTALVVVLPLVTDVETVEDLEAELERLDCVGFAVEELNAGVSDLVKGLIVDDGAWADVIVGALELAEAVVEVIKMTVSGLVDCGGFSDSWLERYSSWLENASGPLLIAKDEEVVDVVTKIAVSGVVEAEEGEASDSWLEM